MATKRKPTTKAATKSKPTAKPVAAQPLIAPPPLTIPEAPAVKSAAATWQQSYVALLMGLGKWVAAQANLLWMMVPERYRRTPVVVASIVSGLVAIILIAAVGIYALGWQNWYTRSVSWVVPFPAAYVNGSAVGYHDYYGHIRALQTAIAKNQPTGRKPTGHEIATQVLTQLENAVIYTKGAAAYHVTVTDKEVNQQVAAWLLENGGEARALKLLKLNYGTSKAAFVASVRLDLLRNKLAQAIAADPANVQTARTQATGVLLKALHGGNFGALTKQYSQDPSAQAAGGNSLMSAVTLPQAVAAAANTVPDGTVVGNLVSANGNFYIVKRVKMVGPVLAVQIIVMQPQGFNQWLLAQYKSAKITKLLPQTRP